ncbi:MAG: DUF2723 domain-containing protein [Candidatus Stahlbacteria bacterium]|nr:DUF2723 domain-containing protein [Candidatus Stahlbacteria bacterium]
MSKKEHLYWFIATFCATFGIFLYTVAPTLSFWDCGELIACGYSLGVPHPPGSPLLTLIIRVFTLIPFGKEIGFRANMLGVICCALSAAFTWLIIVKVIERIKKIDTRQEKIIAWMGGICGAFISAFSYTCWWQAVEAETYGITHTILMLCLWLAMKCEENIKTGEWKKYLVLIAYIVALSSGIHLTPLLVMPGVLLFIFLRNRQETRDTGLLRFIALTLPFFALLATVPLPIIFALTAFAIGFIIWPTPGRPKDTKFFALTALVMVLGFTNYGYLIIRARQNPRINEVAPTNMPILWEAFSRQQYGPSGFAVMFQRRTQTKETGYNFIEALGWQGKFFTDYLIWQWAPYPREERWEGKELSNFVKFSSVAVNAIFILLGLFGMWWHYKREKFTFYLIWITLFVTSVLLLFYCNFKFSPSDPNPLHKAVAEVRERHYFFTDAFALFGLYIGFGLWGLISRVKPKWQLPNSIIGLIALIPIFGNWYSNVNRHGHWMADDYGYNILNSCDDGATIFTNGDNDTFPLWFAQEVKRIKPSVNVANLSLLNTDWHIKQIKQQGTPMSITDWEAANIVPYPVIKNGQADRTQMLIVKDFAVRDIIATSGGFKFQKKVFMPVKRKLLPKELQNKFPKEMEIIAPSYYVRRIPEKYWVRLPEEYFLPNQEFADLILKNGYHPTKPVYFAVTVSEGNMDGMRPYLRMEGLVFRVAGPEGPRFDVALTDSLLNKVFKYRGIFDPKVYLDENTKRLLTNYAGDYFALGMAHRNEGKVNKAIEDLEKGRKFKVGESLIPVTQQLAYLYEVTGNHEKAEEYLKIACKENNKDSDWYGLGRVYLLRGLTDKAKESFEKAIKVNPTAPSLGYAGLIQLYSELQNTDEINKLLAKCSQDPKMVGEILRTFRMEGQNTLAQSLLKSWLLYHPQDTLAQKLLDEIGTD